MRLVELLPKLVAALLELLAIRRAPRVEPQDGDSNLAENLLVLHVEQPVPRRPHGQRDLSKPKRGETYKQTVVLAKRLELRGCAITSKAYLELPSGQINACAGDALGREAHEHVGAKAIVHVVPTRKRDGAHGHSIAKNTFTMHKHTRITNVVESTVCQFSRFKWTIATGRAL